MVYSNKNQKGYIALVALLVTATAALSIGLATSLGSLSELRQATAESLSAEAKNLALACVEDSLERLRERWAAQSGSLSFTNGSCTMSVSLDGSVADVVTLGTVEGFSQTIHVQVTQSLDVVSWEEE